MSVLHPDQFDAFGPRPVRALATIAINTTPKFIEGQALRDVYAATNIRGWPGRSNPVMDRDYYSGVGMESHEIETDETLHTSQAHLHAPTLRSYLATGHTGMTDPDYADEDTGESTVPYHPETISHRGKNWIAEGHHRVVAERMKGNDFTAWRSSTQDD